MSVYASLIISVDSVSARTAEESLKLLEEQSQKTESAVVKMAKQAAGAFAGFKFAEQAKDAVMLASRYEQMGLVMETVGRNTGRSKVELAALDQELQKIGISSLQSRNNIVKMMSANIDLAQATKLARVAQDAAVIGNMNSSEAFERLIYGIQSAEKQTLETLGINVNFTKSYDDLAKQLGKTSDELTRTEKTQAAVNAVFEAAANNTGAYEASMQNALKQFGSLARPLEDLAISLGLAWQNEFSGGVKTAAATLEFLNGHSGAVAQTLKTGLYASLGAVAVAAGKKVTAVTAAKTANIALADSAVQVAVANQRAAQTAVHLAAMDAKAAQGTAVQTHMSLQLAQARQAEAAATAGVVAAEKGLATASAGLGRAALGLAGGLPGLAISAGLVALSFIDWGKSAREAEREASELDERIRGLGASFEKLDRDRAASAMEDYRVKLKEAKEAAQEAANEVAALQQNVSGLIGLHDSERLESWNTQLTHAKGELSKANSKVTDIKGNIDQLTTIVNGNTIAVRENNAELRQTDDAGSKWLASLQQRADFAGNLTEVQRVNIAIEKGYAGVLSDSDQKIALANAALIDRSRAIGDSTKKVNDSKKALSDLLDQSGMTTASLTAMAAAYMDGADSVRELTIAQKVEQELLKTGASARSAVTKAVEEQQDAQDKFDIAKQVADIRKQNKELEAQIGIQILNSKSVVEGEKAQAKYNVEKKLAAILTGKNADALSTESEELKKLLKEQEKYVRRQRDMEKINQLVESTATKQEKLNRKMAELHRLMAEAKTPEQLAAIQRAMKEAQREASQWADWTKSALERVDSAFADAWRNIGDGFKGFRDNLTNGFKQMLAELAHLAITKPIVMQIGGMLGIGQGTQGNNGIWGGLLGGAGAAAGGGSVVGGALDGATGGSGGGGGSSLQTGLQYASWARNAYSLYTKGLSGMMSSFGGYVSTFGDWIGSSAISGLGGQIGGWLGAGSAGTAGAGSTGLSYGLGSVNGSPLVSGQIGNASYASAASGASSNIAAMATPIAWAVAALLGSSQFYKAGYTLDHKQVANQKLSKIHFAMDPALSSVFDSMMKATQFASKNVLQPIFGEKWGNILSLGPLFSGISNTVNKALFGGAWKTKDYGLGLSVDGGEFGANKFEYRKKKGGLFSSSKKKTIWTQMEEETATALQEAYDATRTGVFDLFEALSYELDDGVLDGMKIAMTQISTLGKTEEKIQEEIAAWFDKAAESINTELHGVLGTGLDYDLEGMQAFVGNLLGVNEMLRYLDVEMYTADVAGGRLAERLSELAGGFDALQSGTATYYENFFSAEEKIADTIDSITRAFESAEVELPDTRDAYRSMVEDIDMTTEAGQQMFATLMNLSGQAATFFDIAEQKAAAMVANAMGEANSAFALVQRSIGAERSRLTAEFNAAVQAEQAAAQRAANAASAAASARASSLNGMATVSQDLIRLMSGLDKAMSSALEKLRSTEADVVALRREQSMQLLNDALAWGKAGKSLTAFDGIEGALDIAATLDTGTFRTLEEFRREQGVTSNLIADLQGINGQQLTAEEKLLEQLQKQASAAQAASSRVSGGISGISSQLQADYDAAIAGLDAELEAAQAQMDALNGIDHSILGVGVAVDRMSAAIVAAVNAQQSAATGGGEISGDAATIKRLYESILGYTADAQGVKHWSDRLGNGDTYADLVAALRWQAGQDALGKVPAFASGGFHGGGLRLVGENGPELEVTGPSRIYNSAQTAAMLSGGGSAEEMRQLARVIADLQKTVAGQGDALRAIAKHTNQTARRVEILERWDFDGMPETREAV